MAKRTLLLLLGLVLMTVSAQSQSWRKLRKQAEALEEQGNYAQAADTYRQAWEKKQKRTELIYKAGENYLLLRNYRQAAEAYSHVKDEIDEYPLVGLKYARMLKQDGQYDRAISAFREFTDAYTGDGKAILQDIIETEIRGAELAKTMPPASDSEVTLNLIGSSVNSNEDEFGPIAFPGDLLYYSSLIGGTARIYRSTSGGDRWSKGQIPENFPVIQNGQYCHGTLSPDGERFFFTICEEGTFGNQTTRCEIFVIERENNSWSQPQRLPDAINQKGVTATHPNVVHRGDVEVLYFASNRSGGRGGMDLWYVTRNRGFDDAQFSQPVNLGPSVNTLGDEMTPYYDSDEGHLYFSSNGHPSMGGFDIFKSAGDMMNWAIPENVGVPYNSSADDYYYVSKPDQAGGFFASNRVYAGEKLSTLDDDIFEFRTEPEAITLEGNVFDRASGETLSNYLVSIIEITGDGQEKPLITEEFNTSAGYTFQVLPNRRFRVEVEAPGYEINSYEFFTTDPSVRAYGQPLFLAKATLPSEDEPLEEDEYASNEDDMNDPEEDDSVMENEKTPESEGPLPTYTSRGTAPFDKVEFTTNAPRYEGTYYKVQIIATKNFVETAARFDGVREVGKLQTEFLIDRGLYRVLLASYFSQQEALNAQASARSAGFDSAFVVKYEDGLRYGRVNLK